MPPELENKSREELAWEVVRLRHQVSDLSRMLFGRSSERFTGDEVPKTAEKPVEGPASGVGAKEMPKTGKPAKNNSKSKDKTAEKVVSIHPGRAPLPAGLERREVIIEPEENVEGLKCIGEEVTEELVYEPGYFYVRRYVRRKYAKTQGEGILIGDLPSRPMDKSIASAELAAQIIVNKYADHLPLYRQGKIFERSGVKIPGSTLGEWLTGSVELLTPLYSALKKTVLQSAYVQADETTIKVLDTDKKASSHLGWYWVYHAPNIRCAVFDYQKGRGREGPKQFLEDFKGDLQCDGYEAYEYFESQKDIRVLNCWAHARRYFEKALDEEKIRAEYVMGQIQLLYALERRSREQKHAPAQRLEQRREKAVPVLEALQKWLKDNQPSALPKSLLGTAINYALKRWDKLCIYTTDGNLEIDNNLVENVIRPVALGRKNYLFAGSHESAQRAAVIYSLMSCCKINQVEPIQYFTDVLKKLPDHPINDIATLLPFNWKKGEV